MYSSNEDPILKKEAVNKLRDIKNKSKRKRPSQYFSMPQL